MSLCARGASTNWRFAIGLFMNKGATKLRRVPETAENVADMPARASVDSSVAARAIAIDLRPVISAYRKRGRFMLRVEKLPQSARFSAGQNNGDGSWSLLLDELEDLIYFAPKTVNGDHTLAIRLIAKDETEAFTIALIDYPIPGERDAKTGSSARASDALPDEVRDELHQLKAALTARDAELAQLRGSAERMGVLLQQNLDAAVAEAQNVWKREEAARLEAEKARLEKEHGYKLAERLAERELRTQAIADIARDQQASALRLMRQEFAATKEALTARESELAGTRSQLDRLRKETEVEIDTTRMTIETRQVQSLKAAEAEWQARADKAMAELAAKHQAALAAAETANAHPQHELEELTAQLEQLRQQSQADIADAKAAAEAKAAQALKAAETDWQTQADKALAEFTTKQDAAERASAKLRADVESGQAELRTELDLQRQQSQAEIGALNSAAEIKMAAAQKVAEAEWQARADKALAEQAAKHAAAAGAADLRAHRDTRVAELGAELERQRRQAETEIDALKSAGETKMAAALKAAEAEWRARADKAQAEQAAKLVSAPVDLRAHRDSRLTELGAELDRLRRQSESEIASVKVAADAKTAQMLKTAEAEWRAQSETALAALAARCEAAETALAAAAKSTPDRGTEIQQLQAQLTQLRESSDAQTAAANLAAQAREAQAVKAAEAEWQARADKVLAAMTARCETAETALASVGKPIADRDAEIQQLRLEIERQAKAAEADMALVKAAAETVAGEKLKAAQAIWEKETAGALANANARYDAAEAALAAERRAAASRTTDDEYVHSLEREIKTLRATLVDREAAIANIDALQEQIRLGTVRDAPGTRWQPLANRPSDDEAERPADKSSNKLIRDVVVVVMAAAAAVLVLPKLEAMLPDTIRWQIETVGGLFPPTDTAATTPAPTPPVAATQPKVEHPVMYATRSINVREQPSTGAGVAVNLKRGTAVSILEKRGSWDRVEIAASQTPGQQAPVVQGWVFTSYLADSDPTAAAPADKSAASNVPVMSIPFTPSSAPAPAASVTPPAAAPAMAAPATAPPEPAPAPVAAPVEAAQPAPSP